MDSVNTDFFANYSSSFQSQCDKHRGFNYGIYNDAVNENHARMFHNNLIVPIIIYRYAHAKRHCALSDKNILIFIVTKLSLTMLIITFHYIRTLVT